MHPEDLLTAIQEFHRHSSHLKKLDESIEEEINQGIKEIPQDILSSINNDSSFLLGEANLNIDDLEQLMYFLDREKTQPLQDLDNEQDMYDDQYFI